MRELIGAVVGGIVGFAIGAAVYVTVNPMLEAASGPVRELQGMLWNVVPAMTAIGGALGWWATTRRSRRSG